MLTQDSYKYRKTLDCESVLDTPREKKSKVTLGREAVFRHTQRPDSQESLKCRRTERAYRFISLDPRKIISQVVAFWIDWSVT